MNQNLINMMITIRNRNIHYQSICDSCNAILVDSKLGKKHVYVPQSQ